MEPGTTRVMTQLGRGSLSEAGPPRRYDGLTNDGRRALRRVVEDWRDVRDAILGTGDGPADCPNDERTPGGRP